MKCCRDPVEWVELVYSPVNTEVLDERHAYLQVPGRVALKSGYCTDRVQCV